MSGKQPNVLLITTDAQLREVVRRHQPPELALGYATPADLAAGHIATGCESWIDLDSAGGATLPPGRRRVYFHSPWPRRPGHATQPPEDLPPGLFIRKPCSETVAQVLWAGVERPLLTGSKPVPQRQVDASGLTGRRPVLQGLPHWLLEFHELGLRELCRKCVTRLSARLGYADASMYLHNHDEGVLALAETTHTRPIDLAVRVPANDTHLMAAVARAGKLMVTNQATRQWEARGLQRPSHAERYADGACAVAPLVSGGRLWGVLNLSSRKQTEVTDEGVPLEPVFAFLGRALRYARAYDRARTQARVDPLTSLYNYRWISEALTKEIHRSQRFGIPLAVIMADLDGLKLVNDREGHSAGDCLLRHVAGRITAALRQVDTAARVGGDEFVMLLPATDVCGARRVARRVLKSIRGEAALFRDIPLAIQASLGVAQWEPGWNAAQLIEAADKAMYQAKRQGRNQLVCRPYGAATTVHLAADSPQRLWPAPESDGQPTRDTHTTEPTESTSRFEFLAQSAEDPDSSVPLSH